MITVIPLSDKTKPMWDQCVARSKQRYPFYTSDWHTLYYKTVGSVEKSHFLYLHDLNILAPFSETPQGITFSGGKEIADYMDLIGPDEYKLKAWDEINAYFTAKQFHHAVLFNIPESSPTVTYFSLLSKTNNSVRILEEDAVPQMTLPGHHSEYLSSLGRKNRHELKRKIRKFDSDFPNSIINTSSDPNYIEVLLSLMREDEQKRNFLSPRYEAFFRSLPIYLQSMVRFQILSIEGTPISILIFFVSDASLFLYNSGFLESKYPGSGFYLKAKNIQWALDNGFHTYDFLQGNERYKYELGAKKHTVYTVSYDISS